ncbi:hypothetical protein [Microcoleus sp. FACHB-672]|uniref:hypothetical protein n=1 Tax=Microcoleus sp. FACHB-672 TaxID=2692825 RepID=UPI001689FA89|nr:hypothetical protein [Microcoleus sp. FACHB-672]MBD2042896.1 hypothetical protein [Microcoleus sp. FACHB-672]
MLPACLQPYFANQSGVMLGKMVTIRKPVELIHELLYNPESPSGVIGFAPAYLPEGQWE